jgi:hypothetical protein
MRFLIAMRTQIDHRADVHLVFFSASVWLHSHAPYLTHPAQQTVRKVLLFSFPWERGPYGLALWRNLSKTRGIHPERG